MNGRPGGVDFVVVMTNVLNSGPGDISTERFPVVQEIIRRSFFYYLNQLER